MTNEPTNQLAHSKMTDERRQAIERRGSDGSGVYSPQEGVELHEADRRHPEWRLCQPMSAKGTAGKYLRTDTEEEFDTIDVVAIGVVSTRTFWGPSEFEPGRSPLCYSNNGRFGAMASGDGTPTQHPGLACMQCPDRTDMPWLEGEKNKCKSGYLVALMDITTGEGFTMRFTGRATKLGKYLSGKSIFRRAVVRLSSEQVGQNYVPKPSKIRELDEADMDMAASMFADFNLANDDVDDDASPAPVDENAAWNQAAALDTATGPEPEVEQATLDSEAAIEKGVREMLDRVAQKPPGGDDSKADALPW